MKSQLKILNLEDNATDSELIRELVLCEWPECDIAVIQTRRDYEEALGTGRFDIILSDNTLPSFAGLEALELAKRRCPQIPFIFVSGTLGEELAIESLKNGATDYVLKHRIDRLVPAIRRAIREAEERVRREQAERELERREERFQAFMNNSPTVAFLKDAEGRYVYLNKTFERIFRAESAQVIGKNDFDLWPPEAARQLREHDASVLKANAPIEFLETLPSPDGGYMDWLVFKFKVQDSTGIYLGGVGIEITERKRAEERIRDQADLLNRAYDAIFVCDLNDRILYWNQSASRIFGWTEKEAVGQNVEQLLFKDTLSEFAEANRTVYQKREWRGELHIAGKDQKKLVIDSRWTLVRDDFGNPKAKFSINTDITEQKKLESQFLRAQRVENIGLLASGIAHDLNNLLAPILMAVPLLREVEQESERERILNSLEGSAIRGAALVQQVLSFARGADNERKTVQLKHLILDMERIIKETFPKTIQLQRYLEPDLRPVSAYLTQVHQVLLNLCVNARDAMPGGGTLSITARNVDVDELRVHSHPEAKAGPYVVINVHDTGMGIPKPILNRIFEPFFTTKPQGQGTGLGLSTVLGIIKSHHGFIEVESEPGNGTSFSVFLPSSPDSVARSEPTAPVRASSGNGELILIIDDEEAICEVLEKTLATHGYRVIASTDPTEGLALYARQCQEIALVLTDMMMPHLDGFALIRALKKLNHSVRIVAMSGLVDDAKLQEMTDFPAIPLLRKPYTQDALFSTIRSALVGQQS